jgi:hypothetical protein
MNALHQASEPTKYRPLRLALTAVAASAFVFFSSPHAEAQDKRVELGVYGGYLFGTSAEGTSYAYDGQPAGITSKATIDSSASYGGVLDILVRRGAYAEISYTRQSTGLDLRQSDGTHANYDLTVQYLQIGGLLEFRTPSVDWLRPTFGGTIGATIYSADDQGFKYTEGHLSLIFEGGAKIRISDHFGLRARARLFGTFLTDDSALLCVAGACAFAYTGTVMIQGELGGGAYVAF